MSVRATSQPMGAAMAQQIMLTDESDGECGEQRVEESMIGEQQLKIGKRWISRPVAEGEDGEPSQRQDDQKSKRRGEQRRSPHRRHRDGAAPCSRQLPVGCRLSCRLGRAAWLFPDGVAQAAKQPRTRPTVSIRTLLHTAGPALPILACASNFEVLRVARLDLFGLRLHRRRIIFHQLDVLEQLAALFLLHLGVEGAKATPVDHQLLALD